MVITKTHNLILSSRNHTGRFPCQHRFVLGDLREQVGQFLFPIGAALLTKADHLAPDALGDYLVQSDEGAATNEQDVGRVQLNVSWSGARPRVAECVLTAAHHQIRESESSTAPFAPTWDGPSDSRRRSLGWESCWKLPPRAESLDDRRLDAKRRAHNARPRA